MNKQEAAQRRIEYAADKVRDAQELLDKSLQALSSVMGLSIICKQIRAVSNNAKSAFYNLRDIVESPSLVNAKLDHEPVDKHEQYYLLPSKSTDEHIDEHVLAPIVDKLAQQLMEAWFKDLYPHRTVPSWDGSSDGAPVLEAGKSQWRAVAREAMAALKEAK